MKKEELVITQRADNYSHGFPYMVTDINQVIGTSEGIFYAKKEDLDKYQDAKYKISDEVNAFGNCKVVEAYNVYKTYMFKTLREANSFVNKYNGDLK